MVRARSTFERLGVLVALFVCAAASTSGQLLRSGAGRVGITPDPTRYGYRLGGYVGPPRMTTNAQGVHDECLARALVFERGERRCALVSVELCFLPANIHTSVLRRLTGMGIASDGLYLAATHTHSAADPLCLHAQNRQRTGILPAYRADLAEWFAERIAGAVRAAVGALGPAVVASGVRVRLGMNRNRRGEGLTDDTVTLLRVLRPDGAPVGAVYVYAAHPVYFGADNMLVSGDWSGAFQREMERRRPGSVELFLNGAEGDASPAGADSGTAAERIAAYSRRMADLAEVACASARTVPAPALRAWAEPVRLPPVDPHPFFLLAAGQMSATGAQARAFARRMMPATTRLMFLQVGDILFIGFPGEPTAQIGLAAKRIARDAGVLVPAVTALTNDWLAYILSAAQYRAGRYEASMSFYGPDLGAALLRGVERGVRPGAGRR